MSSQLLFFLLIGYFYSPLLFAKQTANESDLVTTEATWLDGDLVLRFTPKEVNDWHLKWDAPWSLELKSRDGAVKFKKNRLSREDLDPKLPGFSIRSTLEEKVEAGLIDYKMILFFCSKEKGACKREVVTSCLSWQKNSVRPVVVRPEGGEPPQSK